MQLSVGFYQSGPVSEAIQRAQLVESLGFDGIWLNDAQCRWRDVYVTLAAVGGSTSRIFLGTSVTNPLTRHLTVTASAMYTLDELAAGRARMCSFGFMQRGGWGTRGGPQLERHSSCRAYPYLYF